MKAIDAAYQVLKEAGEPLHVNEITRRALKLGILVTRGKTPARTVEARIGEEINYKYGESRFLRVGQGTFNLSERSRPAS